MNDFTAPWGWPQWTMLALMFLRVGLHGGKHGEPRESHNGFGAIMNFGVVAFVLICGGFFA